MRVIPLNRTPTPTIVPIAQIELTGHCAMIRTPRSRLQRPLRKNQPRPAPAGAEKPMDRLDDGVGDQHRPEHRGERHDAHARQRDQGQPGDAVEDAEQELEKELPGGVRGEREDELRDRGDEERRSEKDGGSGGGRERVDDHDGADGGRQDAHEDAPAGVPGDFLGERFRGHDEFSLLDFLVSDGGVRQLFEGPAGGGGVLLEDVFLRLLARFEGFTPLRSSSSAARRSSPRAGRSSSEALPYGRHGPSRSRS